MLMRSSSSNIIIFPSETLDVLIGLSPLSIFDSFACLLAAEKDVPQMSDPPEIKLITCAFAGASFACLLAAEKDVPQMSDPPEIKLITCAFAGGAGAFSGILSGS
uniref:Uncharacterized protein n=1 Tax=Helianthus annuus TaxID=4232 RepID=A0A251RTM3_HELAN